MQGIVYSSSTTRVHTRLAAPAPAGATTLSVTDTGLLLPGTQAQIAAGTYLVEALTAAEDGSGVVTISPALAAAQDADTALYPLPLMVEHVAEVMVDDPADEDAQTIPCLVPAHLVPLLPDGPRETPGARELVTVADVDGRMTVTQTPDTSRWQWGDPASGSHVVISDGEITGLPPESVFSLTAPVNPVNGQLWFQPQADGSRKLLMWDTTTAAWVDATTSGAFVAGNPVAGHTVLDDDSLRAYIDTPSGPVLALEAGGVGPSAFSVIDPATGQTRAALGKDGDLLGSSLSLTDASSLTVAGEDLVATVRALPRGNVLRWYAGTGRGPYTTETGISAHEVVVEAGRVYRITAHGLVRAATAGQGIQLRLRTSLSTSPDTSPGSPSVSWSPSGWYAAGYSPTASAFVSVSQSATIVPAVSGRLGLLTTIAPITAGGSVSTNNLEVHIDDLGISSGMVGAFHTGTGVAPVSTYTKTVVMNWGESWLADNTANAALALVVGSDGSGLWRSAVAWPSQVALDLTGATISKVEMFLACLSTTPYGTAQEVMVAQHGAMSIPAGRPAQIGTWSTAPGRYNAGGSRWFTLDSTWWAAIAAGTTKGVLLRASDEFSRATFENKTQAREPLLRYTYTK